MHVDGLVRRNTFLTALMCACFPPLALYKSVNSFHLLIDFLFESGSDSICGYFQSMNVECSSSVRTHTSDVLEMLIFRLSTQITISGVHCVLYITISAIWSPLVVPKCHYKMERTRKMIYLQL